MESIWNFYDPDAEILESSRNLPHRDQTGALTFVTMRLADSMPMEVVRRWHNEIASWLTEHGFESRTVDDVLCDPTIAPRLKQDLQRFKCRRWHGHLDDCHGKCPLRDPKLASEVSESMLHFNATRYDLERFVIMPNHAHVLIQMRPGFELRRQFSSIMRFSGRRINKLTGRAGAFWQSEPFDHIVRSLEQFQYLQRYIFDNPTKANLRKGESLFWKCGS